MGLDACFAVKTNDGNEPDLSNSVDYLSIEKKSEFGYLPSGATHGVNFYGRFYGIGYERGNWPKIASVILCLMAAPNVECVWYYSDCEEPEMPFTMQDFYEFSDHYVASGNRPYFDAFKL
jgi:hypothetical protein